ncbi:MAG: hypothetical protein WAU41_14850, partial [Gaiellaceae bacterium]
IPLIAVGCRSELRPPSTAGHAHVAGRDDADSDSDSDSAGADTGSDPGSGSGSGAESRTDDDAGARHAVADDHDDGHADDHDG